jgi:hypothetical protein
MSKEEGDRRGRMGRVEGTELVVEGTMVEVQNQARASDPAPPALFPAV